MGIPTYLLAALHGFFAFSHLKDPAGAIKDMARQRFCVMALLY